MGDRPVGRYRIRSVTAVTDRERSDEVATEEPLEIRITSGSERRTLAITMRTPGSDFELAAGFLNGEGITGIEAIAYCTDEDVPPEARFNTVTVRLRGPLPDLPGLDRYFVTSSACGVCGAASLDALRDKCVPLVSDHLEITADTLHGLPAKLHAAQGVFGRTGGLHAAGLFTAGGELIKLREDVGRHNAVDKVVGWSLLNDAPRPVLLVSGRASYEIMQKALAAGISVVAAVSAPSSLAVDVAREFGMTLVGFLREERFNVYAGSARVLSARVLQAGRDAVDAEQ